MARRRGGLSFGQKLLLLLVLSVAAFAYQYARSPSFRRQANRAFGELHHVPRTEPERAAASERSGVRSISGRMMRVSDGDTVWVTDAAGKHKIRLNRIDAPESNQEFGKESTAHLKSLIGGRDVRVEYTNTDRYGRILGIIYFGGADINLQMVKDGCAWHYKHFDSTPAYADAEREARAAKRGLWANPNPIPPYDWRQKSR